MENMMILGLGLDVVEKSRIRRIWERYGFRFADRILHADETARLNTLNGSEVQFLASRFAAKEAAVKALGTGFSRGIIPSHIAVATMADGRPELRLYGAALDRLRELGAVRTHISLTHGRETVAAVVILEDGPVEDRFRETP